MKKTQPVTADEQEQKDRRERRNKLRHEMVARELQSKLSKETPQEKEDRHNRLKSSFLFNELMAQPPPVAPRQDDVLDKAARRAQSPDPTLPLVENIEDLKLPSFKTAANRGGKKRKTRRKRIR